MIDFTEYKNGAIRLFNGVHRVEKYVVWWQTPMGLYDDMETAILDCKNRDLDPNDVMRPVPVAISGQHYEVVWRH